MSFKILQWDVVILSAGTVYHPLRDTPVVCYQTPEKSPGGSCLTMVCLPCFSLNKNSRLNIAGAFFVYAVLP